MSVPVPQRGEGKLEACVKARDLCVYTVHIASNPKNFPPQFQNIFTYRIVDAAVKIHMYAWSANNILVNAKEDLEARLDLQERAARECNVLLSLIEVAHSVYHLESKRVYSWTKRTAAVRNLIRGWRASDKRRYQSRFGL